MCKGFLRSSGDSVSRHSEVENRKKPPRFSESSDRKLSFSRIPHAELPPFAQQKAGSLGVSEIGPEICQNTEGV